MKTVFFDVDKEVSEETLHDMHKERMNGNLVFVCSRKPYYQTYFQYFRYANGYISNDYNYVQMGCCEVMRDVRYTAEEIESLFEKVHPYASLILHGVRDSYVYEDILSLTEYRLVPYSNQTVYSFSVYSKTSASLKEVKELLESYCDLKQVNELLLDAHNKSSSLMEACKQVCDYFDNNDMEIR